MIPLTRINSEPVLVNADLIVLVEKQPETVLKLSTGEFLRVLEDPEEITARVVAYRQRILSPAPPEGIAHAASQSQTR